MIFNMTGGGSGSGATLVVSCPANVTVTVSKDDKSYTKNSGNLGSATFKGLATGEWTVTIEGNEQTATKNITITADYAITIAFFAATINITYPANSNCVVKNSSGQTVASDTNTGSSTKTWTATVGATGTYTVTATATDGSGKTKSTTVSITTDGQSSSVASSYLLVLFDNGTYAAETGGWSGISSSKLTASVSGVADGSEGYGSFYTKNKVDLSGFSTMHFTVSSKSGDEDYDSYFGASDYQSASSGNYSSFAAKTIFKDSAVGKTLTVDISSVNAAYYIRGTVHAWGRGAYSNFSVSKVWID